MKCGRIKELMFVHLQLPTSVSPELFTDVMKSRNIQVRWRPFDIDFHLDLQNGQWEVVDTQVLENIRSSTVSVKASVLQQRSTVQLLHVTNNHDIPISCLHIKYSSIKFEGDTFILSNGIPLPILPTVEKIHIAASNTDTSHSDESRYRVHGYAQSANQETLRENDILNWFCYGLKCRRIKELMFDQLQLPTSVPPEAFTNIIMTRNIQVLWRPFDIDFHLDLQNGNWEVDNTDPLRQLCSGTINICKSDDTFKQKYTIMFIDIASSHEIPISCLYLDESFSKIDAGDVILHSGLRLSCPVSVKLVVIDIEDEGREMTETEVIDILMFVQQSHMLEELKFYDCLLPKSTPAESIPSTLKSRNVKVSWTPVFYQLYILNLQSGRWMRFGTMHEITDTEYNNKVRHFRTYWGDTEWQKARLVSEESE